MPEKTLGAQTQLLQEQFGEAILGSHQHRGDETVVVDRDRILEICRFLQDDPRCKYEIMMDLTAVDYLGKQPRFEVVYHLRSLKNDQRLRVKAPVPEEDCRIDSITSLYQAADWYERECSEFYGIVFTGHPNLKKLFLYEGFKGHPLRKDYPVDLQQPLVPMRPIQERHEYKRSV